MRKRFILLGFLSFLAAGAAFSDAMISLESIRAQASEIIKQASSQTSLQAKRKKLDELSKFLDRTIKESGQRFAEFESRHKDPKTGDLDPDQLPESLRKEAQDLYAAKFESLRFEILVQPVIDAARDAKFIREPKYREKACSDLKAEIESKAPKEDPETEQLEPFAQLAMDAVQALCK